MNAFEDQPCVGLFGTCGDSTFRQDMFIPAYEERDINYFNPQVDDWKPELADIESDHLTYDVIQCWPVLGSTYGLGSLAEQGYSIASSLRARSPLPKFVIPMIEVHLDDRLTDEIARKESANVRVLASTHLRNNESPNVYVVESLEEMLDTSIVLYGVATQLVELGRTYNPALKRYIKGRQEAEAISKLMQQGHFGPEAAELSKKIQP